MNAFQVLGLPTGTRDLVAIRRAYARLAREYRPETDPTGFRRIRDAYEYLREWAENGDDEDVYEVSVDVETGEGDHGDAEEATDERRSGRGDPREQEAAEGPRASVAGDETAPAPPAIRTVEEAVAAAEFGRTHDTFRSLLAWHREGRTADVIRVARGLLQAPDAFRREGSASFLVTLARLVAVEAPDLAARLGQVAYQVASVAERARLDLGGLDDAMAVAAAIANKQERAAASRFLRDVAWEASDPAVARRSAEDPVLLHLLAISSDTGPLRKWARRNAPGIVEHADETHRDQRRRAIRERAAAVSKARPPVKGAELGLLFVCVVALLTILVRALIPRTPVAAPEGRSRYERMEDQIRESREELERLLRTTPPPRRPR
jgi:hypothetical protein